MTSAGPTLKKFQSAQQPHVTLSKQASIAAAEVESLTRPDTGGYPSFFCSVGVHWVYLFSDLEISRGTVQFHVFLTTAGVV